MARSFRAVVLNFILGCGIALSTVCFASGNELDTGPKEPAVHRDTIRLGCLSSPDMPDVVFLRSIMEPVLSRHDIALEFIQVQPEQINESIRQGEVDGDCGRSAYYASLFDGELIRLEPAFRNETVVIWGRKDKIKSPVAELVLGFPKDWNSIKSDVMNLGYKDWQIFDDLDQVAEQTAAGKLDAFVTYYAAIDARMSRLQQLHLAYHRDLYTVPVYAHLSDRFNWLIPELSEAISRRK